MDEADIKRKNLDFWTTNVPGINNQISRDMAGTIDFYKKVDEVRYRQEPYLIEFFTKFLKPGLVSLEVGCGLGSDLRKFSRFGLRVTGLDYSPENAYLSKLGLQLYNLNGKVVAGDAECLPFPENSFDLVYSWGCLHHTPHTQKGVDELFRVLRPGGKAMVMLYHKGYQFWYMLICYWLGFRWLDRNLQDYISNKYDQTPLSRMHSRRQLYKIFEKFNEVNIRVVTFGGIQFHPMLKYVWFIFQKFPWLMKKLGSFAIIFASKLGDSPPVKKLPDPCCPICHSTLTYRANDIKCANPSCGAQFVIYKEKIPVLHSVSFKIKTNDGTKECS